MDMECEKRISLFEEAIETYNCQNTCEELYLQMALEWQYIVRMDDEYMDVFRRADSAMYEDKNRKR